MPAYDLVQTLNPDAPARYSANGRRISKSEYERIVETAYRLGKVDCLSTKAKQLPGGTFQRKNYSCARWNGENH